MGKIWPNLTTEDNINEVPLTCLASEKSNDENQKFSWSRPIK